MSGKFLKLGCKVTSSIIACFGSVQGQAFQEPQLKKEAINGKNSKEGEES
jgi:hypothetical protein